MSAKLRLSTKEQLEFQQLQQIEFWQQLGGSVDELSTVTQQAERLDDKLGPLKWEFTRDFVLHDWQSECAERWFAAGRRGVVKVVTGAGKTRLALAIAERLQQIEVPNLCVAIVVPTVVLLDQWLAEITHSNVPPELIGRLGGGYADSFSSGKRILVSVLNSASKKLSGDVSKAGVADRLLLVVDECHRAGAPEMRKVFDTQRSFSLGLSATPERESDVDEEDGEEESELAAERPFEDSVIGQQLGNVIFELTYADAIAQGILPPFRIVHYGLPLSVAESQEYNRISREIVDLQSELQTRGRKGLGLVRWCKSRAAAGDPRASRYISLLGRRKRFLYRMGARSRAVESILTRQLSDNPSANAILFHESIDEVMEIFSALRSLGFDVVAEHSKFPDAMRAASIRLFREGVAKVIVSARSLVEGFNVPSADIGIVIAATASVRQRIQTLGRLLRRNLNRDGHEKTATLFVLYAKDTVDELIYEKVDWEHFIGAERNEYYTWNVLGDSIPLRSEGPPRRPPLTEEEILRSSPSPGDVYKGDLGLGTLYSLDTQGNITEEGGHPIDPHPQLKELLGTWRRTAGRFRITPQHLLVFFLERDEHGTWRGLFLGRLDSKPVVGGAPAEQFQHPNDDLSGIPLSKVRGEVFNVLTRDHRLIARKERGKVRFVLPLEQIADPSKRTATENIQNRLREAHRKGHRITKFTVMPDGEAVYLYDNKIFALGAAPEGSAGFELEPPFDPA